MENVNGTSVQRGSASDYHHLFQFLHSFLNGIHLVLIVEHKSNLSQFFRQKATELYNGGTMGFLERWQKVMNSNDAYLV